MLETETNLANFFIAFYLVWLVDVALSGTDTELAFCVISKSINKSIISQKTCKIITCGNAFHIIGRNVVDGNSSWCVNPIQIAISFNKPRTILIRHLLPKSTLAINIRSPGENLTIFGEYNTMTLTRGHLLYLETFALDLLNQ